MSAKPLDNLMKQELNRKEFLQYLGAAVLVVSGIAGIKEALLRSGPQQAARKPSSPSSLKKSGGYGSSSYGR